MDERYIKEIEKRIIRKGIFIFVSIGIIVGGLSGVAAYTYSASQISYNPQDTTWKVKNVSDAITDLKQINSFQTDYSTEEKKVGTWIDGKPLYQKTFTKVFSSNTSINAGDLYSASITLNDVCPNIDNAFFINDKSFYLNTRGFVTGWYEKDAENLYVITLFSRINVTGTFTIQYTKTTDTATNS